MHETVTHSQFLTLPEITVEDIETFLLHDVQPDATLRAIVEGQNVIVGRHTYRLKVVCTYFHQLRELLDDVNAGYVSPYEAHQRYEALHPFTDGNGRSGRVLWLWMMGGVRNVPLGFLHTWYYQSLSERGKVRVN